MARRTASLLTENDDADMHSIVCLPAVAGAAGAGLAGAPGRASAAGHQTAAAVACRDPWADRQTAEVAFLPLAGHPWGAAAAEAVQHVPAAGQG